MCFCVFWCLLVCFCGVGTYWGFDFLTCWSFEKFLGDVSLSFFLLFSFLQIFFLFFLVFCFFIYEFTRYQLKKTKQNKIKTKNKKKQKKTKKNKKKQKTKNSFCIILFYLIFVISIFFPSFLVVVSFAKNDEYDQE